MKQPIVLRVYLDGQLEDVKQFTDSQVVIGKNNGLQLQLTGKYIAPLHAVIEERDNGYYISDLGSEHGVFINGQRALDQKIESGSEISIGSYKLQFFVGVPTTTAPATPQIDNDEIESTPSVIIEPEVQAPIKEVKVEAPKEKPPVVKEKTSEGPKKEEPVAKVEEDVVAIEETSEPEEELVKVAPPVVKANSAPAPTSNSSNKGHFAPPSQVNNWMPILEPGKGTVVEVSVAWKERIISSHHFNNNKVVTIGSDSSCDINVPALGANSEKYTLLKVESVAKLNLTPQMSGYYVNEDKQSTPIADLFRDNKIVRTPNGHILDVAFGDMVVLELEGGLLTLYIRYVPQAPKTFGAPIFDLTTAESTAVVLAAVVASIFSLYMMVYSPVDLADENLIEEALVRKAKVTFKVPQRKKPAPKKIEIVQQKKPKKIVKVKDQPKKAKAPVPKPKQSAKTPIKKSGKAASLMKQKKKTNKAASAFKKGGSVKTSDKGGANLKSKKVDPNSMGMLGVFSKGGVKSQLNKTSVGAGELIGDANKKTGEAGFSEDRAGEGLGGKLNQGGGSGGTNVVGIGDIKTGNGTGLGGPGNGPGGLGDKGSASIQIDGSDAEFEGSMDKEAIRRVIRSNKRAIKACYELALNRNKDLYGKLVLQWSIVERGKAIKPKVVSNSLNDRKVASCIIRKLVTWRFPEPPENTEGIVTFPFVFSSQ